MKTVSVKIKTGKYVYYQVPEEFPGIKSYVDDNNGKQIKTPEWAYYGPADMDLLTAEEREELLGEAKKIWEDYLLYEVPQWSLTEKTSVLTNRETGRQSAHSEMVWRRKNAPMRWWYDKYPSSGMFSRQGESELWFLSPKYDCSEEQVAKKLAAVKLNSLSKQERVSRLDTWTLAQLAEWEPALYAAGGYKGRKPVPEPPAPAPTPAPPNELTKGDKVSHPIYGEGVVKATLDNETVTVEFPKVTKVLFNTSVTKV